MSGPCVAGKPGLLCAGKMGTELSSPATIFLQDNCCLSKDGGGEKKGSCNHSQPFPATVL
jgi:hypothetical protein